MKLESIFLVGFIQVFLIQESLSVIEYDKDSQNDKGSFLWRVESTPPSYFFGTIHVPYTRVWDAIPNNAKQAFAASKRVFFELDLTKPHVISTLSACQLLPNNRHLSQEIPSDLYARLKIHMEYVRTVMPNWVTKEQKRKGIDADYLFSAITANWERKRPIWVTLLVNSLTQSDISSRATVLDIYLSQLAVKNRKRVSAVETVQEQCSPLNQLNNTLVAFALEHTLKQQENLRLGVKTPYFSTDDLIHHYRNGNLDAVIFNQETMMFPSLAHDKASDHMEPLTEREKALATSIDDFFRHHMIDARNKRMASRVINLLVQHPGTPFFFAFGAAHFVGENTILDYVESAGFTIKHIGPNETLPELFSMRGVSPDGRNTVQGTFDDLSEEEKTRAYLQFLQYHQQLEQENETKKFQQMLNQDQNSSQDLKPVTGGTEKNGAGENNENDSINGWTGGANSSEKKLHANNTILILMYTIIAAIVFHF